LTFVTNLIDANVVGDISLNQISPNPQDGILTLTNVDPVVNPWNLLTLNSSNIGGNYTVTFTVTYGATIGEKFSSSSFLIEGRM